MPHGIILFGESGSGTTKFYIHSKIFTIIILINIIKSIHSYIILDVYKNIKVIDMFQLTLGAKNIVDMFLRTEHVETVCFMSRKKS